MRVVWGSLIFPAHAADFIFLDGQIDLLQDGVDIGQSFVKNNPYPSRQGPESARPLS
jgi:hypothetical protein